MSFLREFWDFVKVRKKYWLLPALISLAVVGWLAFVAQDSALAPFVYTLF